MSSTIIVKNRSGKEIATYSIELSEKLGVLRLQVSKTTSTDLLQVYLTYEKAVLDDNDRPLSAYGLQSGSVVVYKDLGPQIGWSTVFFAEYLGPIFIFAGFFKINSKFALE